MSDLESFRVDPIAFLRGLSECEGDVARFRLGRHRLTLLVHPEAIRAVLVTAAASFVKGPGLLRSRPLLGDGLLTSDGPAHASDRRALLPAFSTTAALGEYARTMADAIRGVSSGWRDGQEVDVHREMAALALDIATRCFFGRPTGRQEADAIRGALSDAIRAGYGALAPADERPPRAAAAAALSMIRDIAGAALTGGCPAHTRVTDGLDATDETCRLDHAVTLLIGGHESIAIALSWTWMLLSRHAECRAALEAEAAAANRESDPYELSRNLPHARAVLAETLRLFPPAWMISRRATEAVEIPGGRIEAGEIVVLAPCVTHVDERWFDDPQTFRPERWLGGFRPARNAYFPFGSGPRLCVGEPFAWLEGILALSSIAREWRIDVPADFAPEWSALVTLRPASVMPAIVQHLAAAPVSGSG